MLVFLGTGTGSFGVPSVFDLAGVNCYAICSADFNGDSVVDLVNVNSSGSLSVLLNCAPVNIESFSNEQEISVYPNPNNGILIIETNSTTKQIMPISDINGKVVLNQMISGTASIDVSNLFEGVYYIRNVRNKSVVTKRLIIIK